MPSTLKQLDSISRASGIDTTIAIIDDNPEAQDAIFALKRAGRLFV